ncbi:MAG: cation-translocating P-type ATPase family protein, partial [Planctomycetaceae bacterium]
TLDGLFQGRVGADLALSIACLAAILLGEPQVAARVVLIALVGESLEGYTVDRAVQALRGACDLFPAIAHRLEQGRETDVAIDRLQIDDAIVVRPGERLPADGIVRRGHTVVDHSPLTGESLPVDRGVGDRVYAGTLNGTGAIEVTVCCVGAQTAVGQITRLVSQAQANKAPLEREADRLARYFLPVVLAAAGLTLVAWRWRTGNWTAGWMPALAVLVVACPCPLVLATPSAVLAALAWLARHGIVIKGSAALEHLASVDTLAFDKTGTLTTGQLQVGQTVSPRLPEREFHRLTACAARASQHPVSRLLLAHADRAGAVLPPLLQSYEAPGLGVAVRLPAAEAEALRPWPAPGNSEEPQVLGQGTVQNAPGSASPTAVGGAAHDAGRGEVPEGGALEPWLLLGNWRWLSSCGIEPTGPQQGESAALEARGESPVQLAVAWRVVASGTGETSGTGGTSGTSGAVATSPGAAASELGPGASEALPAVEFDPRHLLRGEWLGCVGVTDTARDNAGEVLRAVREGGIGEIVLLTGDRPGAAQELAGRLPGLDAWQAGLLPQDKAAFIEQRQAAGRRVAMVGDGINDALALKSATVGVAVAQAGANLAAEAGDVILLGDPLAALPGLLRLSRALVTNIRRSITWFGFGFNALGVLLSAWGWLSPVASAVVHEAGSLAVMLHALRLLWFERETPPAWARFASSGQALAGWLAEWVSPSQWIFRLLRHRHKLLPLAGCLLTTWWLTRHLVLLQPDERALVQRLGRHHETLGPGLWWRWPPPFETLRRERPERLQTLAFGFRSAPRPVTTPGEYRAPVEWQTTHEDQGYLMLPDEALLLTGDELLVELTAEAQWQITDLREYAAQSADPVAILRGLVESAIREVVARKSLEELLGAGRRNWEADCLEAARGALSRHQLGLRLVNLNLLEVHPPGGVVPSYRDVANALEEREQLLNLGQTQAA